MFLSETNVDEITIIVEKFTRKASTNYNYMNMSFVKKYNSLVVQPFTHICNLSFLTGIFQNAMKFAI